MNYCLKSWNEFTTMTSEERKIWDIIKKNKKPKTLYASSKRWKIICNETKEIFNSYDECADKFGCCKSYICQIVDTGRKLRKRYSFVRIRRK